MEQIGGNIEEYGRNDGMWMCVYDKREKEGGNEAEDRRRQWKMQRRCTQAPTFQQATFTQSQVPRAPIVTPCAPVYPRVSLLCLGRHV